MKQVLKILCDKKQIGTILYYQHQSKTHKYHLILKMDCTLFFVDYMVLVLPK